uniref:Uncharacterized protein n=1 Tax=Romanomermis culicivorax TaxID=13658 RepID=A0A915JAE8_ROMCU
MTEALMHLPKIALEKEDDLNNQNLPLAVPDNLAANTTFVHRLKPPDYLELAAVVPPGNLLHLRNYLGDYSLVVLSLEHLEMPVDHYFVDNNNPHLDLVPYYCCMVAIDQNYRIGLVHDLQNHPDDQNFDYTYCCHNSTTSPDPWAESIQGAG